MFNGFKKLKDTQKFPDDYYMTYREVLSKEIFIDESLDDIMSVHPGKGNMTHQERYEFYKNRFLKVV